MMKITILLLSAIVLSACSSINSIQQPEGNSVDGLTYFMPKRDFLVTLTIEKEKISKVVLGTTPSYPDLSTQYVLRYARNLFGKNTLDVGVNETGLLTSTTSTTVSNVSDVFKNLATTVGMGTTLLKGFGVTPSLPAPPPPTPCADGDHTFVYHQKTGVPPPQACGMTIEIKQLDPGSDKVAAHSKDAHKQYSGVFYRQNIPYLITAVDHDWNVSSIVFSPSESKVHFLPVSRTFFSNNQADFAFVDGIPTKYKQDTESELATLFKLPADVIGAYFAGVGSMFDNFKTKDTKEADALAESLKLELAQKKYEACISAIKAHDDTLIKQLGCQ